jgi:hypothetical protein
LLHCGSLVNEKNNLDGNENSAGSAMRGKMGWGMKNKRSSTLPQKVAEEMTFSPLKNLQRF